MENLNPDLTSQIAQQTENQPRVGSLKYRIIDNNPIRLSHFELEITDLLQTLQITNEKFNQIQDKTRHMHLDVFSIIDFRVLSGLLGETFATELSRKHQYLRKNPNIDGYPDLLQVANMEMTDYYSKCVSKDFIKYKYGGVEIKNTFGVKKSGSYLIHCCQDHQC